MYILYTNELPEIIFQENQEYLIKEDQGGQYFHIGNKDYENICCFADDTNYSCQDTDHNKMSEKLSDQYKVISKFMVNNGLKLNDDKSHLMVFSTSKSTRRSQLAN